LLASAAVRNHTDDEHNADPPEGAQSRSDERRRRAPIIGAARFRAPLDPLVAVLAAVTLARFFAATFNPVPRGQEGRE